MYVSTEFQISQTMIKQQTKMLATGMINKQHEMSQTCIYIFITEMADKQKMKLKLIKRNIKGLNIFYYEKERLMLFFLKLCIVSSLFRGHQKVKAAYIVLEKETYIFLFLSKKCLRFW